MVPKNVVNDQEGVQDDTIPWSLRSRFRSWVTNDRLQGCEVYNLGAGRSVGLAVPPGEEAPKPKKSRGSAKKPVPHPPSVAASPPRTRGHKSVAGPSSKSLGKRPARGSSPAGDAAAVASAGVGASQSSVRPQRKKARVIPDTPRSPSPGDLPGGPSPSPDPLLAELDFELDVDLTALHAARNANTRLQNANESLRAMLRQARDSGRDMQSQNDSLQAALQESEKARLVAEKAALPAQNRATDLQRRLTAASATLAASQDQLGVMRGDLRASQDELGVVRADLLAAQTKLASTETALAAMTVCFENQTVATMGAEAEIEEMRRQMEQAKRALAAVAARDPPYEVLQREVVQLRRLAQARPAISVPRSPASVVAGLQAQVADLEQRLALSSEPRAAEDQARAAVDREALREEAGTLITAFGMRLNTLSRELQAAVDLVAQADVDGARNVLADVRTSFVALLSDMLEQGGAWVDVAKLPSDAAAGVRARFGQ
ncbi:hypothetical protein PLICRDRAFT_33081 [Plicaturopsis crispa FD-325 SS-3]|uniref:Uncharacterized protein n=1 Tax=Plicaturopsis crispa FD-325 SS-3 TaxID=944288 RepID=A0A0C9T4N0_PLICR|nr:hypothetical protein PLICRDRAFT_33081 [Plicaturopsis crispa FD-325 SS-3]